MQTSVKFYILTKGRLHEVAGIRAGELLEERAHTLASAQGWSAYRTGFGKLDCVFGVRVEPKHQRWCFGRLVGDGDKLCKRGSRTLDGGTD